MKLRIQINENEDIKEEDLNNIALSNPDKIRSLSVFEPEISTLKYRVKNKIFDFDPYAVSNGISPEDYIRDLFKKQFIKFVKANTIPEFGSVDDSIWVVELNKINKK